MLGIVYYGVIIIKILIMIGLKWAGVNKGWRAPASRSLDSTAKREEGGWSWPNIWGVGTPLGEPTGQISASQDQISAQV